MLVSATMKSQGNPGKQGFPERQASLHAQWTEKRNGVVLSSSFALLSGFVSVTTGVAFASEKAGLLGRAAPKFRRTGTCTLANNASLLSKHSLHSAHLVGIFREFQRAVRRGDFKARSGLSPRFIGKFRRFAIGSLLTRPFLTAKKLRSQE